MSGASIVLLIFLCILPYFLIIHLGLAFFVYSMIANIAGRRFSIHLSKAKFYASLYGAGMGFSLLILAELFSKLSSSPKEPLEILYAYFGNVPAILLASWLQDNLKSGSDIPVLQDWRFIFSYILLGLMGGWGFGQAIDTVKRRRAAIRAGTLKVPTRQ
jgi:hypothetical protein